MLEFVFPQFVFELQPVDKFKSVRIMTDKNTISRCSDKFKDVVSENAEIA